MHSWCTQDKLSFTLRRQIQFCKFLNCIKGKTEFEGSHPVVYRPLFIIHLLYIYYISAVNTQHMQKPDVLVQLSYI